MKAVALQAQKRASSSICGLCQFYKYSTLIQVAFHHQWLQPTARRYETSSSRPARQRRGIDSQFHNGSGKRFISQNSASQRSVDPELLLRGVQQDYRELINSSKIPSEESVQHLLQRCRDVVRLALSGSPPKDSPKLKDKDNAISLLLDLEESSNPKQASQSGKDSPGLENFKQKVSRTVSPMLNNLLSDERVFITPEILAHYTAIQTSLKKADYFPEIFTLYANKPIPTANKDSTITYHQPNNKNVNNAIPNEIANRALDVAIEQKNLPLALAIIDKSFCMPAYYRSKIFRKAALPMTGLAAAPTAAYICASYVSSIQTAMDPSTATWVAFSAILTYVGATASVGAVAITTANDHMVRVVWSPGMPLRQRWLREEERAAMDKVAVAWGFKDVDMRGMEEGEEWENLREFIGMRGMILDKSDLMEGME